MTHNRLIEVLFTIFLFCLGLAVGSFLNVVIIRGHKGETLQGRSHCVACNKILSWQELVPVASFLAQKRRCRRCKTKISWQYPLVELACGLFYAGGYWLVVLSSLPHIQQLLTGFWLAILIPAILVVAVSDLRFQSIPNGATLTLALLGITAIILRMVHAVVRAMWAGMSTGDPDVRIWGAITAAQDIGTALILAGILGGLWFFSAGRWMGFGDVKLIFATSLILGFPAAIAGFLFAFWSGGIIGVLLIFAGKKRLRQQIPFGPFILLGGMLAWFFSPLFLNQTGLGILV